MDWPYYLPMVVIEISFRAEILEQSSKLLENAPTFLREAMSEPGGKYVVSVIDLYTVSRRHPNTPRDINGVHEPNQSAPACPPFVVCTCAPAPLQLTG
jgi:hypothetical protein